MTDWSGQRPTGERDFKNPEFDRAKPFVRRQTVDNSLWYMGGLFTIYATSQETGGHFTFFEGNSPKGFSPPPHIHEGEHEALFVAEGHIIAHCGDLVLDAPKNSFVFLPQGIVHWFETVEQARLMSIASPGGADMKLFKRLGEPATALVMPPPPDLSNLNLKDVLELGREVSVRFPEFEKMLGVNPDGSPAADGPEHVWLQSGKDPRGPQR